MEKVTDSRASKEARVVAAFGLAGVKDSLEARRALEKVIANEPDAYLRSQFTSALANIPQNGGAVPPKATKK